MGLLLEKVRGFFVAYKTRLVLRKNVGRGFDVGAVDADTV